MKKLLAILLLSCVVSTLPVMAKKRQSEEIITSMTQLEKRQYQTRSYKSVDKVVVMKALLNTLQDEGYIVYNVNSLLGFIYGVKDFDTTDPNIDISKEFGLTKSRLNYNGVTVATLEVTANITDYGDDLRVRVNFKRKLLNQYGNAQFIDDVEDSEFYSEFYEKVDSAITLQKQIKSKVQPIKREIIPLPTPVKPKLEIQQTHVAEPDETKINNKKPIVDETTIKKNEVIAPENTAEINIETSAEIIPDNSTEANDDSTETIVEEIKEPVTEITNIEQIEEQDMKALIKQAKQEAKAEAKLLKEQEKQAKKAAKEKRMEE